MSKPPPMGHNGFSFDTRADLPPDLPRLFFFKLGIQDALDDVLKMPADERGVYLTALMVMYKEMQGLPADDKMAAMSLALDVRQYRHIKAKLIARGVLYEKPSGRVSNRRFDAEICSYITEFKNRREAALEREQKKRDASTSASRSPTLRPEVGPISRRSLVDLSPISPTPPVDLGDNYYKKHNENNEGHTTTKNSRDHEDAVRARVTTNYESIVRSKEVSAAPESRARPEVLLTPEGLTLSEVTRRLLEVADGAIVDPVNGQGMLTMATPRIWIENGADFERDILPAVAKLCDKRRSKPGSSRIGDWSYFTNAVAEQKARREAGLPTVSLVKPGLAPQAETTQDRWLRKATQKLNGGPSNGEV
jgi:uncharacterized protein YdaU (DUF1376 family)